MTYGCVVLSGPSDLTRPLHAQLSFVESSPVVAGPLRSSSLVFHGVDGEELGIDAAIAFTVTEPGQPPVVYAYRTLATVRDCGMRGVMRLNQDVIVDGMQGRSFINQANLQTAQVIRTRFPRTRWVVIEPDRDIAYHQNYERNGFLWHLRSAPLQPRTAPKEYGDSGDRRSAYGRYRAQIGLDAERYRSMWFEVPAAPPEPLRANDARLSKRMRRA